MKNIIQHDGEAAGVMKILGNQTRVWIVRQLAGRECRVGELVDASGDSFASISRHLARLRMVGVVTTRRIGREIWYGVDRSVIRALSAYLLDRR